MSRNLGHYHRLSTRLRELLVELDTNNVSFIGESIEDEKIKNWTQKITEFIKENEEKSPYADLPDTERNILSDISRFLDLNDIDSVKRKLLELAGMIQVRSDDVEKIKRMNRWSIPLALVGFVLTIILGILAWK